MPEDPRTVVLRQVIAHIGTCPITKEVLDMTAVVVVDATGLPVLALSQKGYWHIRRSPKFEQFTHGLAMRGFVVDEESVKR